MLENDVLELIAAERERIDRMIPKENMNSPENVRMQLEKISKRVTDDLVRCYVSLGQIIPPINEISPVYVPSSWREIANITISDARYFARLGSTLIVNHSESIFADFCSFAFDTYVNYRVLTRDKREQQGSKCRKNMGVVYREIVRRFRKNTNITAYMRELFDPADTSSFERFLFS